MKTNTVTNWMVVNNQGYYVTKTDNRADARELKNLLNMNNSFRKIFGASAEDMPFRIAKTVVTK